MFFAEEFPTSHVDPVQATSIVTTIWTVSAMLGLLIGIAVLILAARRNPPIDAQFATKQELHALRTEITTQNSAIFAEIKSMNVGMNAEFSSLNRSMGKLEGQRDLANQIAEALHKK